MDQEGKALICGLKNILNITNCKWYRSFNTNYASDTNWVTVTSLKLCSHPDRWRHIFFWGYARRRDLPFFFRLCVTSAHDPFTPKANFYFIEHTGRALSMKTTKHYPYHRKDLITGNHTLPPNATLSQETETTNATLITGRALSPETATSAGCTPLIYTGCALIYRKQDATPHPLLKVTPHHYYPAMTTCDVRTTGILYLLNNLFMTYSI